MTTSGMRVAVILGTRPEIIKFSAIIRRLRKTGGDFFVIHTGQHYSPNLDKIFFKQLDLPLPKYNLNIRSKASYRQGHHTGRMLIEIEKILLKEQPTHVLVEGDTNTVLAGALAASKISTTHTFTGYRYILGHVEAGLRSYDRQMPEEINRFISDHLSDLLFAPTKKSEAILLKEGVPKERVFVTGNTIVDAVFENLEIAREKVNQELLFKQRDYILATLHRQENVDEARRLKEIIGGIHAVSLELKKDILLPLHPRTEAKIKSFNIRLPESIRVMEPVGFLEFLLLERSAALILTDSGGVQEEASILKVPCVTMRTSTERPETIDVGANILAGFKRKDILRCAKTMIGRKRTWENPFGDGRAAESIIHILSQHHP